jgi:hypothetical protein
MGISSALGSQALVPAGFGFRNLIINGGMTIDQRGSASSAVTNTAAADNYFLDRWHLFGTLASKMTGTQVTVASVGGTLPSDPYQQTMRITSASSTFTPAASAAYGVRQYVEGSNITNLGWGTTNAKTLTLSFWVRSSLTGTYNVSIFNNGNDRSYVQSYTVNTANTWEKKTLYFTGDSSGTWLMTTGIGLKVWWDLGSGSDFNTTAGAWTGALKTNTSSQANWVGQNAATFYLTGVQLEQNVVPTPFEQRPIGVELLLCQRYYQVVMKGQKEIGIGAAYTATDIRASRALPVTMRTDPVAEIVTGTSYWIIYANSAGRTDYTINTSFDISATNYVSVQFTNGTAFTTGSACLVRGNNASASIAANAEL